VLCTTREIPKFSRVEHKARDAWVTLREEFASSFRSESWTQSPPRSAQIDAPFALDHADLAAVWLLIFLSDAGALSDPAFLSSVAAEVGAMKMVCDGRAI
jgi:hypothetical protein